MFSPYQFLIVILGGCWLWQSYLCLGRLVRNAFNEREVGKSSGSLLEIIVSCFFLSRCAGR